MYGTQLLTNSKKIKAKSKSVQLLIDTFDLALEKKGKMK